MEQERAAVGETRRDVAEFSEGYALSSFSLIELLAGSLDGKFFYAPFLSGCIRSEASCFLFSSKVPQYVQRRLLGAVHTSRYVYMYIRTVAGYYNSITPTRIIETDRTAAC